MMQKILEKYNYFDIDLAGDDESTIKLFTEHHDNDTPYDLIILDISTRNNDRGGIIKELRKIEQQKKIPQREGVKIIVISASSDDEIISGAYNALCDGFILKPYNFSTITCQLKVLGFNVSEQVGQG
jgi:DNA-binding NarL/FixJ family response regulator